MLAPNECKRNEGASNNEGFYLTLYVLKWTNWGQLLNELLSALPSKAQHVL